MLLEDKNAVIYGAGGAVGGAVARAFAREGARVFLAGRTMVPLDAVAKDIVVAGGAAETASVDALDDRVVEAHIGEVVGRAGRIDIFFNAIGMEDMQGSPLTGMRYEDFMRPIVISMKSQFLTTTAIARRMIAQRFGVILAITATPARMAFPLVGGFGVACAAIESLCRTLAAELGPHGIRVVCLRSAGSPDSPAVQAAMSAHAKGSGIADEAFETMLTAQTPLRRLPMLAEVANAAVLMASDHASAITGAVANVTCGAIAD